jgi:hypothetical protein
MKKPASSQSEVLIEWLYVENMMLVLQAPVLVLRVSALYGSLYGQLGSRQKLESSLEKW